MTTTAATAATPTLTIPVTITPLACSECPADDYRQGEDALAECSACGHELDARDLVGNVDTDELVGFVEGVLSVIRLAS